MTIQDYIVQQMPHKAKADMAFKQGDYSQAATEITAFAQGCAAAEDTFDAEDPKVTEVVMIGYNNAALMMCRILDATAMKINNPVDDNPYQTDRSLADDPDVPEIVEDLAFTICTLAADYAFFVYNNEPSVSHAMGVLVSMTQIASAGFYYHKFSDNDMKECTNLIDDSKYIAEKLAARFPDDDNIISIIKNYYTLTGIFCEHYAKTLTDFDKMLDWQLKGNEMQLKAMSL